MKKAPALPMNAPRRSKVKTAKFEDSESEEIYHPYAQCLCDLEYNTSTRGHAPSCPQLHLSSYHRPVYPEFEGDAAASRSRRGKYESDNRKDTIRCRQKEDKRLRDIEARLGTLKAAQRAVDPSAQGPCGDDFEEDALREQSRIFHHEHTGGCSVHSPPRRKGPLGYTTPRGPKLSPPKPTSYIDPEEKETTGNWKKKKRTARQPPKSREYIDLEDEYGEEEQDSVSVPVLRYNPKTIASDFLRVIGKHPHLPRLNAHME